MSRRTIGIFTEVIITVAAVLLGVAINFSTSGDGTPALLHLVQQWSVPLIGVAALLILVSQVAQRLIDQPVRPHPGSAQRRTPFPGLEAFAEADSAAFFGRDREILEMFDRLHP